MDYFGTDGDDTINAITLNLPDWTNVYGKAGNDRITIGNGFAIGGAGNDIITGTTAFSTAAFWGSTSGIVVNLSTGIASDGLGGTDTLINVRRVHGTGLNDSFTGSAATESFWGGGGNNTFVGGGGNDRVEYYSVKSTEASISYDTITDTFTIKKSFLNGDRETDTLSGISFIAFTGTGSDNVTLTKSNFVPVGGFLRSFASNPIAIPLNAHATSFKSGDFNGDGHVDFLTITQFGAGTEPAPFLIGLGDGTGRFADGTAAVFVTPPKLVVGGGRTLVADFNKDGVSDIFQLDFGIDAPPTPGGLNGLFVSGESKKLSDLTSTLTQKLAQNHGVSSGDFNGDGHRDILVNTLAANGSGNELYLNDGLGRFVLRDDLLPFPKVGGLTATNTASGVADVNNDGFDDLILGRWDARHSSATSQVLLNDGSGNFNKIPPVSLPKSSVPQEVILDVKSIDLNSDNLIDLMVSITEGGSSATGFSEGYYKTAYIQLLVNKGNGVFIDDTEARLPQNVQSGFAPGWFYGLVAVDFNRDGYTDILASTGPGQGQSVVVMNQGDGKFKHTWSSEPGALSITADVNEDGLMDLITQSKSNAVVEINTLSNSGVYKVSIDGNFLSASAGSDTLIGSAGKDTLLGLSGNDIFIGEGGDDDLNGGLGIDTARYSGLRKDYTLVGTSGNASFEVTDKVANRDGQDSLAGVERLSFTDVKLALDMGGNAGLTAKIIGSVFGAGVVKSRPDYVGIGLTYLDGGMTYEALAALAIGAAGATTPQQIVSLLWKNVVGTTATATDAQPFIDMLKNGMSFGALGVLASETDLNKLNINLVGLGATGIDYI